MSNLNENSLSELKAKIAQLNAAVSVINDLNLEGMEQLPLFQPSPNKHLREAEELEELPEKWRPKAVRKYERYDLSQGLHVAGSDADKQIDPLKVTPGGYVFAADLLSGKHSDVLENEVVFEFAGKTWHFSLIKEACEIRALSEVMRRLYDLLQEGKLIYNG